MSTAERTVGTVDIAVVGQTFCDLVFEGAPLEFRPGTESYASGLVVSPGGAATRAVAAARLGASTALVSELGPDDFGDMVRRRLQSEPGLTLDWVSPAGATPVSVALTSSQDRAFLTYDGGRTAPSFTVQDLPRTRFVHVGLVEGVADAVVDARRAGTVVVAGVGWDESGAWAGDQLDALADIDVFCLNADEALAYTRAASLGEAVRVLAARVGVLVVTDGPRGALVMEPGLDAPVRVPGFAVRAVDPTGAGDVFVAAVMVELAQGADLVAAVRFGNGAAALAVSAHGGAAAAPRREDVLGLLSSASAPIQENS